MLYRTQFVASGIASPRIREETFLLGCISAQTKNCLGSESGFFETMRRCVLNFSPSIRKLLTVLAVYSECAADLRKTAEMLNQRLGLACHLCMCGTAQTATWQHPP